MTAERESTKVEASAKQESTNVEASSPPLELIGPRPPSRETPSCSHQLPAAYTGSTTEASFPRPKARSHPHSYREYSPHQTLLFPTPTAFGHPMRPAVEIPAPLCTEAQDRGRASREASVAAHATYALQPRYQHGAGSGAPRLDKADFVPPFPPR